MVNTPNFHFQNIPKGDRKFFKFMIRTGKGGQKLKSGYTEIIGETLKQLSNASKDKLFLDGPQWKICSENGELTLFIDVSITSGLRCSYYMFHICRSQSEMLSQKTISHERAKRNQNQKRSHERAKRKQNQKTSRNCQNSLGASRISPSQSRETCFQFISH